MKRITCGTHRWLHLLFAMILLLSLFAAPVAGQVPQLCPFGTTQFLLPQTSGATCLICLPPMWNGDLVAYAHGYVSPFEPLGLPEDQLQIPDGPSLIQMITGLGYAFAASGYSTNGLAVREGLADSVDVVSLVRAQAAAMGREVNHVYLTGASQGGLITVLGIEERSDVFDGGFSACGPAGDFQEQIDYWGDVRVLFDYFFPGVLGDKWTAESPRIPDEVIQNWGGYETEIRIALAMAPFRTAQLVRAAQVPVDPSDPANTSMEGIVRVLWYNVHATNDGIDKLGGQPYDNRNRRYSGTDDDKLLNREVARFKGDPAARRAIETSYQTCGRLSAPLVTLHTMADPVVPYWHETLYLKKTFPPPWRLWHAHVPSMRYGHCTFGSAEVMAAFGLLVYKVEGQAPDGLEEGLPTEETRAELRDLARERGLPLR